MCDIKVWLVTERLRSLWNVVLLWPGLLEELLSVCIVLSDMGDEHLARVRKEILSPLMFCFVFFLKNFISLYFLIFSVSTWLIGFQLCVCVCVCVPTCLFFCVCGGFCHTLK